MTHQDVSQGVYITGHFTGDPWQIVPMAEEGDHMYAYAHGKVIRQWKPIKKPGERRVFLDVSALPAGFYTLSLYSEHTRVFKRILIEH